MDHSTNLGFWLASGTPLFAAVAAFYLSRRLKLIWRTVLILGVLALSLPIGFLLVVAAIDVRALGDGFATFLMILVWCVAGFGSAVTLIGLAFDAAKKGPRPPRRRDNGYLIRIDEAASGYPRWPFP